MRLFRAVWSGVDGLRKVLHLLILLFIFSIFIGALTSGTMPALPSEAALFIKPVGQLVEQYEGDPFDRALAELLDDADPQTLVQDVVDALAYAKDDDRVKAVHLELTSMGGSGFSKLQRIARAIDDFKTSGKPVIASSDSYGQGAYYLASRADEIYMHPGGVMFLRGFGIYRTYYKSALDKLRVDWNVFRVGTHKSAVEPFTRDDMSDEDRASMQRLLDQLWDIYEANVREARGLDPDTIPALLDNFVESTRDAEGDLARVALDAGFIDELLTRVELRQRIADKVGSDPDEEDTYRSMSMGDYLDHMRLVGGSKVQEQNVGIVVASGEIMNGAQPPGAIGADSLARQLRRALRDDSVKAVVLRVDSPGGSTFASDVILHEILALRDTGKPVVASMSSLAASGGYVISMAADRIYANTSTITGSIGIYGMFPTFQRSLEALGLNTDGVATSIWAGELRADREMSEDMKTVFQLSVESGYDHFVSQVSKFRGIEKSEVDRIGQGQVWTGADAIDNGLIDEIGTLEDAVHAAAELAGIGDSDYGEKLIEEELSPTEQMLIEFLGGAKSLGIDVSWAVDRPSSVERLAGIVEQTLKPLTRFDDPKGIYAHCLCDIW